MPASGPCGRPGAVPCAPPGSSQRMGTTSSTTDRCTAGAAAAAGSAVAIGWSPSSGAPLGDGRHHEPDSEGSDGPGGAAPGAEGRGAGGGVAGVGSGVGGAAAGGVPIDISWTTGSSAAAGTVEPEARSPVLVPTAAGRASGPPAGSICTTGAASGGSGTRCCGGRVSGGPSRDDAGSPPVTAGRPGRAARAAGRRDPDGAAQPGRPARRTLWRAG